MHAYDERAVWRCGPDLPVERSGVQLLRQAGPGAGRGLQHRGQTRGRETPLSAIVFDRILREAGVPDGVVNMVSGYGHTVGAQITAHPDVEKVAFTGSPRWAARSCGRRRPATSLGHPRTRRQVPGADFDDADLDTAIMMASFGCFLHSGQVCMLGSRIFAQRGVYERVVGYRGHRQHRQARRLTRRAR